MNATDLYNIKDGDSGKTVADGLKANFEGLLEEAGKKVDKVEGKGLSTNDYTNEEKQKVAAIGDIGAILDDINGEEA